MAIVFLGCIFFFRAIDNGSLIAILLKMAGFTYGPLLGLFAFGIFTKRQVRKGMAGLLCVVALVFTFLTDLINNPGWYTTKLGFSEAIASSLGQLSGNLFHGYQIGVELLIINAAFTYLLLLLASVKGSEQQVAAA